jgi:hypothetical protein
MGHGTRRGGDGRGPGPPGGNLGPGALLPAGAVGQAHARGRAGPQPGPTGRTVGTSSTTMRRALAVGATVLLLWGAVVVGAFVGGLAVGIVRPTSTTTGAVLLVLATAACWSFAVRWAARAVVPRLAGRAYLPATPEVATRLTTIAVGVAAAGVGMLEVGGRVALAVAWGVGLGVLGVVVVRWRPAWRRGARTVGRDREVRPSLQGQEGAIAAEHVAVIIVLGAVTAALVAAPIAPTVGVWARYAVCTLFGGDCEHPDAVLAGAEPSFACERRTSSRGGGVDVGLVVDVSRGVDYTITEFSDGTVSLTYANDGAVGTGVGGGLQVDLYWGEGGLTLGGHASGDLTGSITEGDVYVWSGPDAAQRARDYRTIHALGQGSADLVAPGGRNGAVGWVMDNAVRAGNAALNWAPVVDGVEVHDPERTLTHVRGGIELSGSAGMGGLMPGTPAGGGPIDTLQVEVAAAFERALGATIDRQAEEITAYVVVRNELGADAEVSSVVGTASWADESVVAIRTGLDGTPIEATVTTYRIDEAGRDLTGTSERRDAFPDRRFADGTVSGAELTSPSLYQVQTRLDLTDPGNADALANVLGGAALQVGAGVPGSYAGEYLLRPVHERGETVIVEYDASDRAYGARIDAAAIGKVTGGGRISASDRQVVAAYYYDEVQGAYVPWIACTG